MSAPVPVASLRDVGCLAGKRALLADVCLDVGPGECVLLCGRSGSGKTTLTKCMNGLVPALEPGLERTGELRVLGMEPLSCETWELARVVGSVFQNPRSQFYHLTSTDELAFGLENRGTDAARIAARVREVVSDMGLERLLDRDVSRMSGGERQALVFASVAVADPELYVLDEPTANLDERATSVLHDQIAAVLARGKTVVVAEHRLAFLSDLVTRALLVEDGRIVREMGAGELASLTEGERLALGLRATLPSQVPAPHVAPVPSEDAPALGEGLSLRGLSVLRHGRQVFSPLSLDAPRGMVTGIVGANGAGKSTLLRALAGLERRTQGRVTLDGVPQSGRRRRRRCSMVMQDVNHQLFSDSVRGECELSCRARGDLDDRGKYGGVDAVLRSLDLTDLAERHPMSLSGGQKQRLAIACAMLSGRPVALFDEPTSGLDLGHMIEVSALMRRLADAGTAVLVATHDWELLDRCCDRVFRLEGRGDGMAG